jgi:precorrin-3B methylase
VLSTAAASGLLGAPLSTGSVEISISDVLREIGPVVCIQDIPGNTSVLNKTFSLVLSIPILTNNVETVNALVDKALLNYIIGATPFVVTYSVTYSEKSCSISPRQCRIRLYSSRWPWLGKLL